MRGGAFKLQLICRSREQNEDTMSIGKLSYSVLGLLVPCVVGLTPRDPWVRRGEGLSPPRKRVGTAPKALLL